MTQLFVWNKSFSNELKIKLTVKKLFWLKRWSSFLLALRIPPMTTGIFTAEKGSLHYCRMCYLREDFMGGAPCGSKTANRNNSTVRHSCVDKIKTKHRNTNNSASTDYHMLISKSSVIVYKPKWKIKIITCVITAVIKWLNVC